MVHEASDAERDGAPTPSDPSSREPAMSSPRMPDDTETDPAEGLTSDGHRATDMPSLGDPARIALPDPFAEADAELLRQPAQSVDPEPTDDQS
ncbi:hypothetical protein ACXNSR_34820 [Streptomyces sp. NC-S4]